MNKSINFLVLVCAVSSFLLVLHKNQPSSPLTLPDYRLPNTTNTQVEVPLFKDISWAYGVVAGHRQSSKQLSSSVESLAAGVCIADVNQDHWMDIFVVGGSGTTREYGKDAWWHQQEGDRLYLNVKGRFFQDISVQAGIDRNFAGMGCAIADMDNDGLQDIILSGLEGHLVYRNAGQNRFRAQWLGQGKEPESWFTQGAISDVNGDGLLDVYSSRFIHYRKGEKTFESAQGFVSLKKVDFNPELYDPQANALLINRGDMVFEEHKGALDTQNVQGRSLGAKWFDFNQDNHQDLLIINGFGTANRIFLNNQNGKFVEDRSWLRRAQIKGARSVVIDDLVADAKEEVLIFSGSGQRNTLLEYVQDSVLENAEKRGLAKKSSLHQDDWGSVSADLNNDGFKDVYVASGKMSPDEDSHFVSKSQKNRLYVNDTNGGFTLASGDDPSVASGSGRGVASVDIDNDGQLEVVVANNNGWLQLLKNTTEHDNNWVGFEVDDLVSWQGGTLIVRSGERRWQTRVFYKQGLFSQSDPRFHFGLGKLTQGVSVTLSKPGRKSIVAHNLQPDSYYQITDKVVPLSRQAKLQTSPLAERLGSMGQAERLVWARLLLDPDKGYEQELLTLWHSLSPENKGYVLSRLESRQDLKALTLIFEALRDEMIEVRLSALELLRLKEMERSVNWLLPLFASQHTPIVCKVAEMFRYFHVQEEAILHRKSLAGAPMLRALSRANWQQQMCLLEALAASENKRAVGGIVQVLEQSPEPQVRAAAVRALGQIRDVKGTRAILAALHNESAADVIAESLIALSRLRYSKLQEMFHDAFLQPVERRAQLSKLIALVSRQEDIVLPSAWIKQALDFQAYTLEAPVEDDLLVSWLSLFGIHGTKNYRQQVMPYLADKRLDIKAQGFISLLNMTGKAEKGRIEQQLLTSNNAVRTQVMQGLDQDYRFTQIFLQALVKGLFDPRDEVHETAFETFQMLPIADQSSVLSIALKRPFSQMSELLITQAEQQCLPPIPLSFDFVQDFPVSQRLALLNWFYGCHSLQEQGLQALEWRVLLNDVLNAPTVASADKLKLVSRASFNSPFVANQWLPAFIDKLPRQQVLSIIGRLPQRERNEPLQAYLNTVARDETSNKLERLFAYSLSNEPRISQALNIAEN